MDARVFISNNQNGEESKTERDRERVCVRDSVSLKVKDRVGHKWTVGGNIW